jgi:2-polyprenyl-6-hydroxyphenyl methylase/3-demethylubiquinone-9 3-methyltransferase
MHTPTSSGYVWKSATPEASHNYLLPAVRDTLAGYINATGSEKRLFDLGCGNGSLSFELSRSGWDVTGIDPSSDGISQARAAYPNLNLHEGSAYEDLAKRYGKFPAVISLEVVEHVYYPRRWASTLHSLLLPGGIAVVSTPYHGYLKNLALAATNKLDSHFTALWDHGHIKFWSINTLRQLLEEAGLRDIRFLRVGRVPPLAKSMIAIARRV